MTDPKVVPLRGRKLHSWIDAFQDYMKPFDVPPLFATWTGLVTIAAAVERKVWHVTKKGQLFPNVYALLLGPSGSGKTVAIHEGRRLLEELEEIHIAASNVSSASLIDELNNAQRRLLLPKAGGVASFNSLVVMSNEFGVFLPTYDTMFLSSLTDMWDGKGFSQNLRKLKNKIEIPHSTVSILAGWTPSALNSLLPEGAWQEGFMSRMAVIYSGENSPQDLWGDDMDQTAEFKALADDLKAIHNIYGPTVFSPDALEAIRHWHLTGGPPKPDHPRLATYLIRRSAMLIKLCILCSLSYGDGRVIELEHYQHALRILYDTEKAMPDAFKAMQTGGDMNVIKDVWHIAYQEFMRTNKTIPQRLILQLLMERTPAHNVGRLLDVMVRAGYLEKDGMEYTPRGKRPGD